MKSSVFALGIAACAFVCGASAAGQTAPKAAVPAPERTTATFGDWMLRCERRADANPPQRFCEVAQIIQRSGDAGSLAQIGLGKVHANDPIGITVLLPINVSLQPTVKVIIEGREERTIELAWQRCLPTGCFARAVLSDDMLKKFQVQKDGGKLEYRDSANREVVLPISFRGLGEAWQALSREASK